MDTHTRKRRVKGVMHAHFSCSSNNGVGCPVSPWKKNITITIVIESVENFEESYHLEKVAQNTIFTLLVYTVVQCNIPVEIHYCRSLEVCHLSVLDWHSLG